MGLNNETLVHDRHMGLIKIENEKVIIIDSIDKSNPAKIIPCEGVKVLVDGNEISNTVEVYEKNKVEIIALENRDLAKRELELNVSEDNMEARISIMSTPKRIFKVKDCDFRNILMPNLEYVGEYLPPAYTEVQLLGELSNLGIIYGICNENIKKCCEEDSINNVLVAKGKKPLEPVDDEIEVFFQVNKTKLYEEDESGNVDFKSIGTVQVVRTEDVIGVLKIGKEGSIGFDVYGHLLKAKKRREKKIFAKNGCVVVDNKVIATTDGKPYINGNKFSVESMYSVEGDVDISKGNIKFIGDIVIHGNVKDGMKVEAGNCIDVKSSVLRGTLLAAGDVKVEENIITSNIFAGVSGVDYTAYLDSLGDFHNLLSVIYDTLVKVNYRNMITTNIEEKEVIKVVIEGRFKSFNTEVKKILSIMGSQDGENDALYNIIKNKLLNIGYSPIEKIDEIKGILDVIQLKINSIKGKTFIRSNVFASYVQDSKISSTGSICIEGKGVYKSELNALEKICFINERSVLIGGTVSAENEIRCKIVGNINGVRTVLKVKKYGRIHADTAYYNTKFIVGKKEYVLDEPSRNICVYLDKDGEIVVEKFKM